MVTDMQRMGKAQLQMELAGHPTIGPTMQAAEVGRRVLEAANIDDINAVIPEKEGPSPMEELQLKDAIAEVSNKEATVALTQAQTEKTRAEAQSVGPKLEIEHGKLITADKKTEMDFLANMAQLEQSQHESERDHNAAREDAHRQFHSDQLDAAQETVFRQKELEQSEYDAEQQRELEKLKVREDSKAKADANKTKADANKMKAKAKPKPKGK
jgi:hypothetical protein